MRTDETTKASVHINYSVTREKAPVYTMGSPDARAYSRNKRGIAGSLIWINFDRHALLNLIQQCAGTFVADIDEIRPQYTQVADGGSIFQSSIVRGSGSSLAVSSTINQYDNQVINSASQTKQLATAWYSDQVLPFDITLSGANEYGAMCAAKIYGVEILNEGWGISIDDAVSEMQATFVARVVEPMSAISSPFLFRPGLSVLPRQQKPRACTRAGWPPFRQRLRNRTPFFQFPSSPFNHRDFAIDSGFCLGFCPFCPPSSTPIGRGPTIFIGVAGESEIPT